MESTFGIQCQCPQDEGSWTKESFIADDELKKKEDTQDARADMIASKMLEIVKEEQSLADVEKCNRKNEKKRMRKSRREVGSGKTWELEGLESARHSQAIALP